MQKTANRVFECISYEHLVEYRYVSKSLKVLTSAGQDMYTQLRRLQTIAPETWLGGRTVFEFKFTLTVVTII